MDYDLSVTTQVYLGARKPLPALIGLPNTILIDVYGDLSWNVVYVELRDSTGEIFYYRAGSLGFLGWRTLAIDLRTTAPATTFWGNGDRVLDAGVGVFRLIVGRGPDPQALQSTVIFDNLRCVCEPWSALAASPAVFAASIGESTRLRMTLPYDAAVETTLTDEIGRSLHWRAAVKGGVAISRAWDGRDDTGRLMTGSVRARLAITRAGSTFIVGVPYLAGIPLRKPGPVNTVVGMNAFLGESGPNARAQAEKRARDLEAARVGMIREAFDWNRVEPRAGEWNWETFDQLVEVSRAHNLQVLGGLGASAAWASSAPVGTLAGEAQYYPPRNIADYLAYVRAVVTRYKDRVHHWEVWNEPNLWRFWRPKVDAVAYAALLKQTAALIRSIDPKAMVVLGGLVGTDTVFLDALRANGAWDSFDVFNFHSFVINAPEASGLVTWLGKARAYLDAHGSKPIWITELCWPTGVGTTSTYPPVTEAEQAAYVPRAYLTAAQGAATRIFWYSLVDHDSSSGSRYDHCGLFRSDGTPKQSWETFRQASIALDGAVVSGPADPSSASRKIVSGLETTQGWSLRGLAGGAGTLARTTERREGTSALQLDYTFSTTATGVSLETTIAVPGLPSSIGVWVQGDGSANPVYLAISDATGERFSGAIGPLERGWRRYVLQLDALMVNWAFSGGDGDGVIDYPVTVRAISVYRAGLGQLSGRAVFDRLEAAYGPRARSIMLVRGGETVEAVYSAAPATVALPITGVSARRLTTTGWAAVSVVRKAVNLATGPVPAYLAFAPEVLPARITPNGDGIDDRALFGSVGGEQARSTFQVYALDGRLLRTLRVGMEGSAGIGWLGWDGRLISAGMLAPAPAGTYYLRLTVLGPDGRSSVLQKKVAVDR